MSDFYEGVTKSLDQATGKSSLYWGWFDKGESHSKSIPYCTWRVTTATVITVTPPTTLKIVKLKAHRNAQDERLIEGHTPQLEKTLAKK